MLGGFASQEFLCPHNVQLGFEKASGLKCNRKLDKPAQRPAGRQWAAAPCYHSRHVKDQWPAGRVTSHALEMLLAWTPVGRAPLCCSRNGEQPKSQPKRRDISARSQG